MTPAPAPSTQRLLYLHGFRSSPRSFKAQRLGARCTGAHLELLSGGDHALSNFDELLPTVLRFLNLCD